MSFAHGSVCSSIDNYAFKKCSSLSSIKLPSSISNIGSDIFSDCSNLNNIIWDTWQGNTTMVPNSFAGVCPSGGTVTVTNPSGHESRELLEYLLDNGGLPESWAIHEGPVLPEGVYIIENNILKGFTKAFLDNPDAYNKCYIMQIPARVTEISQNAFYINSSTTIPSFVKRLTFQEGSKCTSIGAYAFTKSSTLTSISLPNTISTVSEYAFESCAKLNLITWDGWKEGSIGGHTFQNVSSEGTVVVNNEVNGKGSAELLSFLKNHARLPEGWGAALSYSVYKIENNVLSGFTQEFLDDSSAYSGCNTMQIPANVTSIKVGAFYTGDSTIPSFVKKMTFANDSNCSSIGINSFVENKTLTSIDFLNATSLTSIESQAFSNCTALNSITLPSNITALKNAAFYKDYSLKYIAWDLPSDYETMRIDVYVFGEIATTGKVKSLNPSITSQQMLDWIVTKGSFPENNKWTADN